MLHQNHLEGLLRHVLLGPAPKVSDSVGERGLEYWHFSQVSRGCWCCRDHTLRLTDLWHTLLTGPSMFVCSVSNSVRIQGFPGGSDSEEFTCNAGDVGWIPQLERSPGEGNEPAPVFFPGEFHGYRSLVGLQRVGRYWATTLPLSRELTLKIKIRSLTI